MTTDNVAKSEKADAAEAQRVERQLARNWYLLAGITVLSTIGLVLAIAPVIGERIADVWPWANTYVVLLVGLALCIALLVWHLTSQQKSVNSIRTKIEAIREDSRLHARQQSARLHALLNVSRMMGAISDPESVFKGITDTCIEIFECQQASLMLLNASSQTLEVRAYTGHLNGSELDGAARHISEGVAGWVARNQKPLVLGPRIDRSQYPDLELNSLDLTAAMVVPIVTRNELVGVLNISSRVPDVDYTDEDVRALEVFAENAGAVIRHSERAEWMRQTIEKQMDAKAGAHEIPAQIS